MKKFRDYLVEFDAPTIYCDMDGVLADFVKFTREHLGQKFTDENWHDLPPDMFINSHQCLMQNNCGGSLEDTIQIS